MAKGIDPKFVHYGIRKDDLATIEAICEAESMDFNWLSEEILKAYHAKKVDVIEIHIRRLSWTAQERYEHLTRECPELFQRANLGYIASFLGITQQSLSRIRANGRFLT